MQIEDACIGGERRGGKCGRGSDNNTPVVQATGDTQQPIVLRLSLAEGFPKAELERWAREHHQPDTTVHSDGVTYFSGVEAAGCGHEATVVQRQLLWSVAPSRMAVPTSESGPEQVPSGQDWPGSIARCGRSWRPATFPESPLR